MITFSPTLHILLAVGGPLDATCAYEAAGQRIWFSSRWRGKSPTLEGVAGSSLIGSLRLLAEPVNFRSSSLLRTSPSAQQATSEPIVCCPKRLYAGEYEILQDTAKVVFGGRIPFVTANAINDPRAPKGKRVIAFGSAVGGEVKLPPIGGRGGFFVDWILALVDGTGELLEFVAVEVQSIDTTGNYRREREAHLKGHSFAGYSDAGINWENVNKRILPQLIYKGHVLRREVLCKAGLFFICPTPVYERIAQRVGGNLTAYPAPAPGTLTFRWYDIGPEVAKGKRRELVSQGQFTTTVEQVAYAFLSPGNMPPEGSYAKAIKAKLKSVLE